MTATFTDFAIGFGAVTFTTAVISPIVTVGSGLVTNIGSAASLVVSAAYEGFSTLVVKIAPTKQATAPKTIPMVKILFMMFGSRKVFHFPSLLPVDR